MFVMLMQKKYTLVYTILSQTPQQTPQVPYDASRISAWTFLLSLKEHRMLRKWDHQGRLSFHFFERWITDLATHRQKKNLSNVLKKFVDAKSLTFYMELNETD